MTYSVKEAAERLEISEITLRRILTKGEINYHKIGKQYRLTENDIAMYIMLQNKAKGINHEATELSGNISLTNEMIKRIENETLDLQYGIVKFELHIVDCKLIRYTLSREQSVKWDKNGGETVE